VRLPRSASLPARLGHPSGQTAPCTRPGARYAANHSEPTLPSAPRLRVIAVGGTAPGGGYSWAVLSAGAPGVAARRGKCRTGQALTGRGEGLWILTRGPADAAATEAGVEAAQVMGFDTSGLRGVGHEGCDYGAAPPAEGGGSAAADAGGAPADAGGAAGGSIAAASAAPAGGVKPEPARGLFRLGRRGAAPSASVGAAPRSGASGGGAGDQGRLRLEASDGAALVAAGGNAWQQHVPVRPPAGAGGGAAAGPLSGAPGVAAAAAPGGRAAGGSPALHLAPGEPAVTRIVYLELEQGGTDLGRVILGL
jgi:hypothetical protein